MAAGGLLGRGTNACVRRRRRGRSVDMDGVRESSCEARVEGRANPLWSADAPGGMKGGKVQTRASLCQKTWRRLPFRAAAVALRVLVDTAVNICSGKSHAGTDRRQVPPTSFMAVTQRRRRSPSRFCCSSCCPARLNLHSIVLHNGWVRQLSSCPAARRVAVTGLDGARSLTSSRSLNSPGLHRRNNVPQWQRMHQTHDGLRQWQKGPRAKFMLYPYYALLASTSAATMYMMGRMVLVRLHCFDEHNTSLMPHAGSQDLVLQQLNDCLLYITAIELLYAKSKIPTPKAAGIVVRWLAVQHPPHVSCDFHPSFATKTI